MDPEFFRHFAGRVRQLMMVARTDAARRQLALWVDEFEQRAEALDGEAAAGPGEETKQTS